MYCAQTRPDAFAPFQCSKSLASLDPALAVTAEMRVKMVDQGGALAMQQILPEVQTRDVVECKWRKTSTFKVVCYIVELRTPRQP